VYGVMENNIKDSGKIFKCMVREYCDGANINIMMANFLKASVMDLED